jgi:hypothetical protein
LNKITFHYGLALLPNQEGYRFRGWLHNGDLIPCVVRKNALGMHYAVHEETGAGVYDSLKGWTPYIDTEAA